MSKHIHILKDLAKQRFAEKHPTIEERFYPAFKFSDTTANGLTVCIMSFLSLSNHFAARVNVTGTYSKKLNKYIRSGSTKGMADITAVVDGKHWSIEVKKKDSQRPEQKKVEEQVKASGGVYTISRSFDQFYEFYTSHS